MNLNDQAPVMVLTLIVVGILTYGLMTMKDDRPVPEQISETVRALPQNIAGLQPTNVP